MRSNGGDMRSKQRRGDRRSFRLKQTKPPQSPESAAALQKALRLYREGRLEQAEAAYLAIIAKAPDYFDAHLMLGDVLAELQRHDGAIASYDRALEIKPGIAEALYNRGNSLLHLNRNEEAAANYDRALASTPDHVYA